MKTKLCPICKNGKIDVAALSSGRYHEDGSGNHWCEKCSDEYRAVMGEDRKDDPREDIGYGSKPV